MIMSKTVEVSRYLWLGAFPPTAGASPAKMPCKGIQIFSTLYAQSFPRQMLSRGK